MSTGRVYISRDVVFDKSVFPFASLHPNAGALLRQEILLLPTHLQSFDHGGHSCTNQTDNSTTTSTLSLPVQVHGENGAENGAENDQNLAEIEAIFHVEEEDEVGAGHDTTRKRAIDRIDTNDAPGK